MESVQQCRKIREKQSSGKRLPLPVHHAPKQTGNTRATCRGIMGRTFVHPPAHKRITGKYMLDIFGGTGCLAEKTNHLGFRGAVLNTKFRSKMRRKNDFTSTTTHSVLSQCSFRQRFHRKPFFTVLACPGLWNTFVARGNGTCRKSRSLRHTLARPGPWRVDVFLGHRAEKEHYFVLGTWMKEKCTVLITLVLELVNGAARQDAKLQMFPLHVTTPTLNSCLSRLP